MGKTVACIIARTVSTRLPLKVLRKVNQNYSMLDYIIQRTKLAGKVDDIYLCTSSEAVDDIMEDVAEKNNINIFRGSPDVVIDRMVQVGNITNADNLIRITGDDVFSAYEFLDRQISFLEENGLDYVRLIDMPLGASAEVMSMSALKRCYEEMDPAISEYLTLFIFDPSRYKCGVIKPYNEDYSNITLTVDTPADYARTKKILHFVENNNVLALPIQAIVNIINEQEIADSYFTASGNVKLPYGKEVSYLEFLEDMKTRESKSLTDLISIGE